MIVRAEIWFRSDSLFDTIVIGACTESGNMTVLSPDYNGDLNEMSIPEILQIVDAIEDVNGNMVIPSMAVIAAYVDEAYERFERYNFSTVRSQRRDSNWIRP
jgi:hypothetical protein